jgi:hypothetical protein
MGKSSRNNLASELGRSEEQGDVEEASVQLGRTDEVSASMREGLVVLDSRRRSMKAEKLEARRGPRGRKPREEGSREVVEQIGQQLRSLYEDVLNQPVPDRFLELLNKLETDTISARRSKTPGER